MLSSIKNLDKIKINFAIEKIVRIFAPPNKTFYVRNS